jgi:hypothetical protein
MLPLQGRKKAHLGHQTNISKSLRYYDIFIVQMSFGECCRPVVSAPERLHDIILQWELSKGKDPRIGV